MVFIGPKQLREAYERRIVDAQYDLDQARAMLAGFTKTMTETLPGKIQKAEQNIAKARKVYKTLQGDARNNQQVKIDKLNRTLDNMKNERDSTLPGLINTETKAVASLESKISMIEKLEAERLKKDAASEAETESSGPSAQAPEQSDGKIAAGRAGTKRKANAGDGEEAKPPVKQARRASPSDGKKRKANDAPAEKLVRQSKRQKGDAAPSADQAGDESDKEDAPAPPTQKGKRSRNKTVVPDSSDSGGKKTPSGKTSEHQETAPSPAGGAKKAAGKATAKATAKAAGKPAEKPAAKAAGKAVGKAAGKADAKADAKAEAAGKVAESKSNPKGKKKTSGKKLNDGDKEDGDDDSEENEEEDDGNGSKNGGFRNSCFSSVVIQLLDYALEVNLDSLVGNLDANFETFGLSEAESKKFDITSDKSYDGIKGKYKKLPEQRREAVRTAIKEARDAEEVDKISLPKHFLKMIADLRAQDKRPDQRFISAFLFQQVMAFGRKEDVGRRAQTLSVREDMNGDTQQDAMEYLVDVLNALLEHGHTGSKARLRKHFEIHSKTVDSCTDENCGFRSGPFTAKDNHLIVKVPAKPPKGKNIRMATLFKEAKHSPKDLRCPDCKERTLVAHTEYTQLPEIIFCKVNRTTYHSTTGEKGKTRTPVDLDPYGIKLEGQNFHLIAVVHHDGNTPESGHYTVFREHYGRWYLLDDKTVTEVKEADVKDHARKGQSAILMFEKAPEGVSPSPPAKK
ncbi:uncharacterized protein LTR77_003736 [Saxophila tyrrhenica]|uniref:USP domain-containing protein n=1 Tax=Saxophila tyrrhenica TaxID=1690608 RepID=A0AAV9PEM5_9PEZI|nr:hypothetical protein LTR77_003736 [Saxophila tyrrhenica]